MCHSQEKNHQIYQQKIHRSIFGRQHSPPSFRKSVFQLLSSHFCLYSFLFGIYFTSLLPILSFPLPFFCFKFSLLFFLFLISKSIFLKMTSADVPHSRGGGGSNRYPLTKFEFEIYRIVNTQCYVDPKKKNYIFRIQIRFRIRQGLKRY